LISFIDNVYNDWIRDIDDNKKEVIEFYKEIYLSTKKFIRKKIKTAENRYKLYNSLCDNFDLYGKKLDLETEQRIAYSLEERIGGVVCIIWKMMFDVGEKDFGSLIKEEKEYFVLSFSEEKGKKVAIIPGAVQERSQANKFFEKYLEVENKPSKWYFKNNLYRGVYEYSHKVNDIRDAYIKDYYNTYKVNNMEKNNCFYIECLACIDINYKRCSKDNMDYIFSSDCKEEVKRSGN